MEDRDEPSGPRSPVPSLPDSGATQSTDARTESLDAAAATVFQQSLAPLHALVSRGDTEELAVGDRLGHWTLTERLGQGGMGSVFVAERDDGLFRQRVAVKILRRPADAEAASHLDAERALLAGLVHPGIARLYDGGSTPGGQPFLVMEHVEGTALNHWRHEATPTLDARLALFDRLCDAVAYAHRQFVVHCDLKPSNILVRADGTPMLLDFGIARWIGSDAADGAPERPAGTYCTPAYASPEQVAGARPGVASDVFSLGILLAELLADAPMRRGAGDAAHPVRLPSRFAADAALAWRRQLRGDLDAIVAKATALEPGARYPDVTALRSDLARHRDHLPIAARPAGWARRGRLFLRRYRRGAIAAGVGLAMATGFTVQLVQERDRAREAAATAEQVSEFMVGAFDAANVRRDGGQRDLRARDVLKAGAERIERDLAGQPGVQARLLLALGNAYVSLWQPAEAVPLLERALALAEQREDDMLVAIQALEQLSLVAGNDGHGETSLAYAQRAIALREEYGYDDPEGQSDALNNLGLALRAVQRLDEAREALREALRLREQLPNPEREQRIVSTLNNLALVERLDGRYDDAIRLYEQAILRARQLGASGEYSLINLLGGLGRTYSTQRRFDQALPPLREAHALALRLYGERVETTAAMQAELGIVYWDLGRLAEAEAMLRATLEVYRETREPDAMSIAIAMNNLGVLLEERGDPEAALPLLAGSLAIRSKHLKADDPVLRRAVFNVARTELNLGDVASAAARTSPYVEDVLAHPQLDRVEWWAQATLALEIDWQGGKAPSQVLETLLAWPTPSANPALDPARWRVDRLKARLFSDAGQHGPALATIEHAVDGARRSGSRLDLATAQLVAARIAADGGNLAAARRHLSEALPALDSLHVPGSPQRRDAAALAARLEG